MNSKIPKEFSGARPFLMGKKARIVANDLTNQLGIGGREGVIYGQTVPSSSGVTDVVGLTDQDYAINVFVDDLDEAYWLIEDLVEISDESIAMEFSINIPESAQPNNTAKSKSGFLNFIKRIFGKLT